MKSKSGSQGVICTAYTSDGKTLKIEHENVYFGLFFRVRESGHSLTFGGLV